MDFDMLRSFVEVAREGNVTMAAAKLNISQPGLTKRLNALEAEIGYTLLIRDRKETQLTESGKHLLKYAEEILAISDRMQKELFHIDRSFSGDVYIGTSNHSKNYLIARTIRAMRLKYPGIRFHIRSYDNIMEEERAAGSDFGIFLGPVNMGKFHAIRLGGRLHWGVLMKREDPLAVKSSIKPEDLIGLPLICPESVLNANILYEWSGYQTKSYQIIMTYNLVSSIVDIAKEGPGYVLALNDTVDLHLHHELTYRPLEPTIEDDIYIVWRKNRPLSEAAQLFLDEFRKVVDSDVSED